MCLFIDLLVVTWILLSKMLVWDRECRVVAEHWPYICEKLYWISGAIKRRDSKKNYAILCCVRNSGERIFMILGETTIEDLYYYNQ